MNIPTIGAREIQFRSHLEAQSSFVSEQLQWDWEYEPFDLNKYVTNFIISLASGEEILTQVKEMMNIWDKEEECKQYKEKIELSG